MNQRKKRMQGLVLCFVFVLAFSSLTGCGAGVAGGGNAVRRLTPEIDFWQDEEAAKEPFWWTSEEVAPVGDFSLAFMREAVAQAQREGVENPVLSPVSAYLALTLAAMGSSGKSEREFAQVLGLSADEWGRYGGQLMRFMNQSGDAFCLATGNSLWSDEGVRLDESYIGRISKELYSEAFEIDLSTQEAKKAINRWADERTGGMIPELRNEPYDDMVLLVILNAVYLEAQWEDCFSENETVTKPFYTGNGLEMAVRFLSDCGCWRDYVTGEGLEGILLPYKDSRLAFLALRATDGRTPQELLSDLSIEKIRGLAGGAVNTYMNVSLPKFTLECDMNLKEIIGKLGVEEAMVPGLAGLAEMGAGPGGQPLYISDIGQKAKIEVDEEGTKAAAVTEIIVGAGAAVSEPPRELHLDSPFLYAVIDRDTGLPLFIGILENPAVAQE